MEQLGFKLPLVIRDIGIQRNRIYNDIEATENMIQQYNDIMNSLDEADVRLLNFVFSFS